MKQKHKMHMGLGSYIIIFLILGVITAISLFIFLPRNDYERAFNNVITIQDVCDEKNINRKNIDEHLITISNMLSSGTYKTRLNCYMSLISILQDSNNICLNALTGIDTTSDYNDLLKEQDAKLQEFIIYKNELSNHIAYGMNEVFKAPTPSQTIINQYVGPFLNKLQIFMQYYADFYLATAEIIDNTSLRSIDNNELVIVANMGINLAIQRLLSVPNINSYATDVNSLRNYATIMLDEFFYRKYYSYEYTVSDVNYLLNQIC